MKIKSLNVATCAFVAACLAVSLLSACGGSKKDDDGGGSNPNLGPQSQSIAFAQGGPLELTIGGVVNNAASASGQSGSGSITYASSNSAVATVDSTTGSVSGIALGSVTITATKAADANFSQAQASYTLYVRDGGDVSAWIGSTSANVTLSQPANGADFIRARNRNCNPANYAMCTNGQSTLVSGAPSVTIADTTTVLGTPAHYWLRRGATNSRSLTVSSAKFSERMGHTALYYNNRYWVIGGSTTGGSGQALGDVWSSADAKNWEREHAGVAFGARWLMQGVVYANHMWLISGVNTSNFITGQILRSTDGVNWTQVSTALPGGPTSPINLRVVEFNGAMWAVVGGSAYRSFDGVVWELRSNSGAIGGAVNRAYATLTVYNNRLWYVGGAPGFTPNTSGSAVNDVWSSTDGTTWTQVTSNAAFTPRFQHNAFVLNNRLWIFGGRNVVGGMPGATDGRSWSTTDGVTWTEENTDTYADSGYLIETIQEPNKVTMIGGVQRVIANSVYQSSNGVQWREMSSNAQFPSRTGPRVVSFSGALWAIGGMTFENGATNEIWRSVDAVNWSRVIPTGTVFSRRINHQTVVMNGRMWVIGGWDEVSGGGTQTRLNDVWSSSDGVSWRLETANAAFTPRNSFGAAVLNNRIWVLGGATGTNMRVNDVWSSADGITWTLATPSAAFTPRFGHSVVAYNNMLWVLGGDAGGLNSDVWTSPDGIAWTWIPPTGPRFSARAGHEAVVHNNRIYIVAGANGVAYPAPGVPSIPNSADVLSTTDGLTWTVDTALAPFKPRTLFGLSVHNGTMTVIGGLGIDRFNDVWRSTDGANWSMGYSGSILFP